MSKGRVVVIGAGMGGLLAARVLADRAASVVVIDRDELPSGAAARKGVPQGRHAHGLLASGEGVIRQLCPGLMEELVEGGAQVVTMHSGRWFQAGGYKLAADGPTNTFLSRPFLEGGLRGRLEAMPSVSFVRSAVSGLVFEDGGVRGVTVDDGSVPADLVVDCSGRGSQAGKWLASAGYGQVPVARVHIDMGYATRVYRRTPGRLPDGTWFVTIGDPSVSKRFGVAFPIEGDRWIVTLAGMHGDHAPTDPAGFVEWAEALPTDDIASVVRSEEALSEIVTHRLPSDQWRHFEKMKRHPAGFVALGDSICSFNPIYGQGMSSAAQQAAALGGVVDGLGLSGAEVPGRFYRAAAKVIANPWGIAAGADFLFAETTGDKPPMVDLVNRYVGKAIVAAQHDPVVSLALFEVQNLLAPPPSLMKPRMMRRVFRAARLGPNGARAGQLVG